MYTIGDGSVLNYLHHLILPSIVLALVHVAIWSRYMRTATLDAISQDFVKTARAKGLSERRVLLDRKSTRLNSSHANISYAVFCLQKNRPSSLCAHRL